MRRSLIRSVGPGMALLGLGLLATTVVELGSGPGLAHKPSSAAKTPVANKPQVVEAYGKLPLSFEANQGQTDSRVNFLSRGSGYTLFLSPTEAVLALRKPSAPEVGKVENNGDAEEAVLRMKLVGANPSPRVSGLEELPSRSNYFIGNDPKNWRTNVPHYAKVQYKDVYPGVDLVYYGNQRQLEYDLVVAPGTDPGAIQLAFEGEENLEIDAQGDLVLDSAGGQVRLHKPLVYQQVEGVRREISGSYVLTGVRQVGFRVGAYDAGKPLVIDPVLSYSTYLGGIGVGFAIAVDASGNAYVTGFTGSTDFPTASPIQPTFGGGGDAFVMKLNAAGNDLVYSTYLGGSGTDTGNGIAVDSSGNAYVTGRTDSTDFPTASPIQPAHGGGTPFRDAFVTKLNAAGSALVYSTYLGGSGREEGNEIGVDAAGNAYVTGFTFSTDFPTASPIQPALGSSFEVDAFVTKLNATGSALVYSTYLGGSRSENGNDIAVDASGNAYVTGFTRSTDFPTVSPIQAANAGGLDVFVTKLNAAGNALVYSTYLGGSGNEFGQLGDVGAGIAVDASGNAYVTGVTDSLDFPTASPIQPTFGGGGDDVFAAKLNAAGNALVYSTYLGGSGRDSGFDMAVDASGNAYVTGNTASIDFPTVNPFQPAFGGGVTDAFIAKITDEPPGLPTLPADSVVNGASFRPATDPNSAIAPGAIVAIFGTDLASDTQVATAVPLPTTLGDTSVTFNNIPAPLFFVSGSQINAQVPFELMTGTGSVTVQVKRGTETSTAQPIGMAAVSPGIFTLNRQGTGPGAILHADSFQPVNDSAPAQPGAFLAIFCTGLGPVQPEVESGDVAPSTEPLARTLSPTLVNISDIPAFVTFSGLAPGFVGLYQVNVQVPMGVPSGVQEVEIIINNVPSNTVTIAVQ